MLLLKRTPGKPLTEAELRQRRNAARARWAAAGIGGAAAGAIVGAAREGVWTSAQAANLAREQGMRGARAARTAQIGEIARQTDRRERVLRWIDEQLAGRPGAAQGRSAQETAESLHVRTAATVQQRILAENMTLRRAGRPVMTPEQQQARFDELMAAPGRQPTARVAREKTPPIGTLANKLIYDRQIWQAQGRLKRAERWRDRLTQSLAEAGEGFPEDHRSVREVRANIDLIRREIKSLETKKKNAFRVQARAGTQYERGGKTITAKGVVVRQYRGGEPTTRGRGKRRSKADTVLAERISAERSALTGRRERFLERHGAHTATMVGRAERHAIEQMTEAVRQGYSTGAIASRILRRAGRGAVIGAVAGLTASGVAMLARHVATAGRRHVEKSADIDFLEPLAKAQTPEDRAAIRLARIYRRWIDRLLGRDERPVDLGDGFVEALGPHITEAYTKGLTSPPITEPDDPRYRIDVDFDLLNPAQRRHIAEYALDRIVEITDAQREAIRQAIADQSVMRGIGPLEVARTIKEAIGLTTYQRGVVAGFRNQLTQLDPRALERELRDKRYDRTVRAAIETNTPLDPEQLDAMVDAYHRKMLALRSQTIARTEALRAESYGGLARAQEVLDRHPELEVTKRWLATDDNRTRDTHRDLNGKEVDGMTSHFVTSAGNTLRWPLDEQGVAEEVINCRCTLQYVFRPKRGQIMAVAA